MGQLFHDRTAAPFAFFTGLMLPLSLQRLVRTPGLFLFSLVLTGLLASYALLRATPNGMGLANDSAAYIGGARGIISGQGYSDIWLDSELEPITHYPPLFSLVLAGLGLMGLDPLRGARLINVLAFGISTILLGLLGWKMTRSRPGGLLLAVLFGANPALFSLHTGALSEPLFLLLSLVSLILFSCYFDYGKFGWVTAVGLTAGLAYLTRYTGLALAATFCVALLLLQDTWRKRLISIIVFLLGFTPFVLGWAVRNSLLGGNVTNRSIGWHPLTLENIRRGVYAFSNFLMPVPEWQSALFKSGLVHWFLLAVGLILLAWLLVTGLRHFFFSSRFPGRRPEALSFTAGLYVFGYLSAVVASMSLFDASTKFQPRILSPFYVSFLILLVGLGNWLWQRAKLIRIAVIVLAVFSLVLSGVGFSRTFLELQKSGQGYASWKWRDSPIMATLKKLPQGTIIYTNSPPAVYLVTGRPSRVLPTPVDAVTLETRSNYEAQLTGMRQDVLQGRAVLAIFDISEVETGETGLGIQSFLTGLPLFQKQGDNLLFGLISQE